METHAHKEEEVSMQVIHRFDTVRTHDHQVLKWARQLIRPGILHKVLREPLVVSEKSHRPFLLALDQVAYERKYPSTPQEQLLQDQAVIAVHASPQFQFKSTTLKAGEQWLHWEDKLRLMLEVLFLYKNRAQYMDKSPVDLPLQARQVVMSMRLQEMRQSWKVTGVSDHACILSTALDVISLQEDKNQKKRTATQAQGEPESSPLNNASALRFLVLAYYLWVWRDFTTLPISLEQPMLEWFEGLVLDPSSSSTSSTSFSLHKEMTTEEKETCEMVKRGLQQAQEVLIHKASLLRSYLSGTPFSPLPVFDACDQQYLQEAHKLAAQVTCALEAREKSRAPLSSCPQAVHTRLTRSTHSHPGNARKMLLHFCHHQAFTNAIDSLITSGSALGGRWQLFYDTTAAELEVHTEGMPCQRTQLELRVNDSFHPCTLVLAPAFKQEACRLRAWCLFMVSHEKTPEVQLQLLAPHVFRYLVLGLVGWELVVKEWMMAMRPLAKQYISFEDMTRTLSLIDKLLHWLDTLEWVVACLHVFRWLLDWENPGCMSEKHFSEAILPWVTDSTLYPTLLSEDLPVQNGMVRLSRMALFELCHLAMSHPLAKTGYLLHGAACQVQQSGCSFVALPCVYPFEDQDMADNPTTYRPRILLSDATPFQHQGFSDSVFTSSQWSKIPHPSFMTEVLNIDPKVEHLQRWFTVLVTVELFQRTGGHGRYIKWYPQYFQTCWEAPTKGQLLPIALFRREYLALDSTDITPLRVLRHPDPSPIYDRYAPFLSRPMDPRLVERITARAAPQKSPEDAPSSSLSTPFVKSPAKKPCVARELELKEPGELDSEDQDKENVHQKEVIIESCPVLSFDPDILSPPGYMDSDTD